jgi:hypothetical protein
MSVAAIRETFLLGTGADFSATSQGEEHSFLQCVRKRISGHGPEGGGSPSL